MPNGVAVLSFPAQERLKQQTTKSKTQFHIRTGNFNNDNRIIRLARARGGSRVMKSREDKGRISGPFVPMLVNTMKTPAWRALSHGARSLFLALKSRYNVKQHNNGKLYLSTRQAADELGSNRDSITRWFRELQHYGFIAQTTAGCLGVDGKGKAPHWRLTELGCMGESPTRDFERWDGVLFEPPAPKSKKPKKQNPGPESGATLAAKVGPPLAPKVGPPVPESGPESGAIYAAKRGPEIGAISRLNHLPDNERLGHLPLDGPVPIVPSDSGGTTLRKAA